MVGTKSDLRGDATVKMNTEEKDITKAEGDQLAKDIKATCYMETSAKTGEGIQEVFEEAVKAAMVDRKTGNRRCIFIWFLTFCF